jgi:two-component system, OmpR family, sensor histidine kinase VicK
VGFSEKKYSTSNTTDIESNQYKATFDDKLTIISAINDTNSILVRFIQNSVKHIDICGESNTWPLAALDSPEYKNSFEKFKERKGRIRVIMDINANSINNCKVLMTFGEVRHINDIKGNFSINDAGEYIASILSREPESDLKLLYSNSVALLQQQLLIFNGFWNIATPAEQKIREIEGDSGSIVTTIIDDPQEIINRATTVTESSRWLSVCSTAEWIDSLNQEIGKSFRDILEKMKNGKHKGIRWLC